MGKDLLQCNSLYFATRQALAPLPLRSKLAKAGCILPDLWKIKPRYLQEGDTGERLPPTCHCGEEGDGDALKATTLVLGQINTNARGLLPWPNWARCVLGQLASQGPTSPVVSSAIDDHGRLRWMAQDRQRVWEGLHVSPRTAPSRGQSSACITIDLAALAKSSASLITSRS